MNCLNCHWFGFAATHTDAVQIIQDTGVFYLTVAFAYLLSFLYMIWHSSSTKKKKRLHIFAIIMWATFGECLILQPAAFSLVFNGLVLLLTLLVLYQLQFTSALMAQASLSLQKASSDDKKAMYANTLLTKMNYTLSDILGMALMNEQILWLVILYKAAVGFRASFGL
jgi:hypothetical protein